MVSSRTSWVPSTRSRPSGATGCASCAGTSLIWKRRSPQAKALELLLGGEFVDAEEALRIGMINRVYDDEELLKETYAFAAKLAANPVLPMAMIKRTVRMSERTDMRTSLDLISSHMAVVMSTDEAKAAMAAMRKSVRG